MRELFRKIFLYWVPYGTYTLLLFDIALAEHLGSWLISKRVFLFVSTLLLALALLGIHLYLCFKAATKKKRQEARFSLGLSTFTYILLLILLEVLLPPLPCDFTKTQIALQRQLERRNQIGKYLFRGIPVGLAYNELGWTDKPGNYLPKPPESSRIVFIGDSFLEATAPQTLAAVTEQFLKHRGAAIEIINLSKDDTGLEQYRHRFWEFALELNPDYIFLFIYEGNDLSTTYSYEPYTHPPFQITKQALTLLEEISISEKTKKMVSHLKKHKTFFKNKAELFVALPTNELSLAEKNLIYLASYGYMCNNCNETRLFPKLCAVLNKIPEKLIQHVRSNWLSHKPPYQPLGWVELNQRYVQIFKRPKEERLEAIAKLIAQDYLLLNDYHPCLNLLEAQEQRFIAYLTEQQDMLYYLLPAIKQALLGTVLSQRETFAANAIEQATDQYMKLFEEFQKTTEAKGISLTIVLIPEASYADEDFRQFWAPMIDFQRYFSGRHALYLSLKRKLVKDFSVIDVGDFSGQLRNTYWRLDGHWNEKGHQKVGEIIATYMLHHEGTLRM